MLPETIKRGQPVEFVHDNRIQFGICVKDGKLGTEIEIETPRGVVKSWHILSYAWTGWLPEEIIKVWEKHNPTSQEEVYQYE